MTECRIGAQRSQEGLLVGVFGVGASEQSRDASKHSFPVVRVEALERRESHERHHPGERSKGLGCETVPVRLAVVGHVEWVQFARLAKVPVAGEIVHAEETWEEPGGGGAVAAAAISRLTGAATLYTALGDDELGERTRDLLTRHGVEVHSARRPEETRRAFTFVDERAERTIAVLGSKLVPCGEEQELPWRELARFDGVYFASGDRAALEAARRARVVVATSGELETLRAASIHLDGLVGSGRDEGELYRTGDLEPPPRVVVTTAGALGGWAQPGGPYEAVVPLAPVSDSYGCGDAFAAGLTIALAQRREVAQAVAFAALCGAEALAIRGAGTA